MLFDHVEAFRNSVSSSCARWTPVMSRAIPRFPSPSRSVEHGQFARQVACYVFPSTVTLRSLPWRIRRLTLLQNIFVLVQKSP